MRRRNLAAALVLWGAMTGAMGANAGKIDYTGHYELTGSHDDRVFTLDITQTGAKAVLSFSASMTDGSGAAPDGDGQGEVDDAGVLKFKFTDSFGNAGKATLVSSPGGYLLRMDTATVADPRPLRFYGDVMLKKTADKPSS